MILPGAVRKDGAPSRNPQGFVEGIAIDGDLSSGSDDDKQHKDLVYGGRQHVSIHSPRQPLWAREQARATER